MVTRDRAMELAGGRSIAFSLDAGPTAHFDAEQFEAFVELAATCGATHIGVGVLPYLYSWFLPDSDDPYAAWCNQAPGLMRVCPPEAVREWIPQDSVEPLQAAIEAKLVVCRKYGLRGVVSNGLEPLWLPEGVYRAHPHWRGPQVELARISKRPYFAPSIDEPEVLDLYRESMRGWVERFPEIDEFSFMSNDSGAGISWSPNLYPGMNGPVRWRTRDPGERVAGWMIAMQDAAREAGGEVRINLHSSGLPAGMLAATRARLKAGLFINWGNNVSGDTYGAAGASLCSTLWSPSWPAVGLSDPKGFITGLQAIYAGKPAEDPGRASVSIDTHSLPLAKMAIEAFFDNPGAGLVPRTQVLIDTAARFCGSAEKAEQLVGAWEGVAAAKQTVAQVRQKGFGLVLPWGGVSMRWLMRPLVPEPEKLTDAETAYFRRHLFSVRDDVEGVSFGYVLGKGVFRGESVTWMARWCLQEAITRLKGVAATLETLAAGVDDEAAAERVRLLAGGVGVFACATLNARNTIMYQYALDTAHHAQFGPQQADYDDNIVYDNRALSMRKIAREEADNIAVLIRLLRDASGTIMACAADAGEEGVFLLGPDPLGDLQRKLDIMYDHWQDYERLYPATKVWDFEPRALEDAPAGDATGAGVVGA